MADFFSWGRLGGITTLNPGAPEQEEYRQNVGNQLMGNAPRPGDLPYQQAYNPLSMSVTPDIEGRLAGINTDKSGINQYRKEALRSGPSNYANLAHQQQDLATLQGREGVAKESASATAGARASLAMHGGAGSGASERLAKSGAKNYLSMSQDVNNQANLAHGQIGLNDEQNRIQQLGALPGMENQAIAPDLQKLGMYTQAREGDITNQINEGNARNAFNLDQYRTKFKAFEGGQQANATLNAKGGKKG